VLAQNEPIMSPSWSPDGSHLAYVSFETGHAVVFVQSLYTNQRKVLADFRAQQRAGLVAGRQADGDRADARRQFADISGGPDGSNLRRITFSGAIDTEPHFSPDGQYLLFHFGSRWQRADLSHAGRGRAEQRLTFGEGSNYSPRHSPDGSSFVFAHRNNGKFYIAMQDFQTGQMEC